jgi:predicted secreted protein
MANVRGEACIVYINTGSVSVPAYTAMGSEQGMTLSKSSSMIDIADKGDAGWPDGIMGARDWSISANGVYVDSDAAYLALDNSYLNQTTIMIKIKTMSGYQYTGTSICTSLSEDSKMNDVVKFSCTLKGASALVRATAA